MTRFYFLFTLLLLIIVPEKAFAHGANIEYRKSSAITIQAKYDDGQPMGNAQVTVYAPKDPATPWLKGTTDDQGNFSFIPEVTPENSGNWDVKVRHSGHGNITSIPLAAEELATNAPLHLLSATGGYSPSQKIVMAAAVGWGFVGTALFFSRSKSE